MHVNEVCHSQDGCMFITLIMRSDFTHNTIHSTTTLWILLQWKTFQQNYMEVMVKKEIYLHFPIIDGIKIISLPWAPWSDLDADPVFVSKDHIIFEPLVLGDRVPSDFTTKSKIFIGVSGHVKHTRIKLYIASWNNK